MTAGRVAWQSELVMPELRLQRPGWCAVGVLVPGSGSAAGRAVFIRYAVQGTAPG